MIMPVSTKEAQCAREVAKVLEASKRKIYREFFFRTMSIGEFNQAWRDAIVKLAIDIKEDEL